MTRQCSRVAAIVMAAGLATSIAVPATGTESLNEAVTSGEFQQITSVLAARDGEVIYERYWGDGSPQYLNDTRSATKSITAMAVGAALMDGHIESVQSSALAYLDAEFPDDTQNNGKADISIRDLLTMSSALDCDDNDPDSPGNEERMYPSRSWRDFVLRLPTRTDFTRDERGFGPFHYCTAGSFLLGQIVEYASGEPVDSYIEQRLFAPLGIQRVAWGRSPAGEVMTGGGTGLTSHALLALAEMTRLGGRHKGGRVLPQRWVREMLTAHVKPNEQQDYGYQWWRRDFACGAGTVSGWYMAGNGGNKVVVIESLAMSIVVTATRYGTRGMHQQSTDIIERYLLPVQPECRDTQTGSTP